MRIIPVLRCAFLWPLSPRKLIKHTYYLALINYTMLLPFVLAPRRSIMISITIIMCGKWRIDRIIDFAIEAKYIQVFATE